jgi:DNA-binding GntR family transcriptional regulator
MNKNPTNSRLSSLNLVRETLTQQICRLLKSKILNGELTSGMRIWADELAEELGVSIAPVKEALLIFAGEGLINNIPRRGSVVRTFSIKEMHELYQVRRLLEVEALEVMFAEHRVTDEFVEEICDINQQIGKLRNNAEFKDRNAAFELDWQFHQRFMQNCEQSLLTELYSRLNTQAQIIRYASWNIGPRGDKTFNEHDDLVSALAERDLGAARHSIVAHLGSILNDFDQAIERHGDSAILPTHASDVLPSSRRKSR